MNYLYISLLYFIYLYIIIYIFLSYSSKSPTPLKIPLYYLKFNVTLISPILKYINILQNSPKSEVSEISAKLTCVLLT